MLSATGVYIWWKKSNARRFRKAQGASVRAPLEPRGETEAGVRQRNPPVTLDAARGRR